jgi:hypothetical protein
MDHKLTPFQQHILDRLNKADIHYTAGRQTGKSTYSQYINQWHSMMQESQQPKYKIITSAQVDGKPWHTVQCSSEVSKWIRTQPDSWQEHIDARWNVYQNMFDISEELYMMIVLRFGK